jgi:hypothetical protein
VITPIIATIGSLIGQVAARITGRGRGR